MRAEPERCERLSTLSCTALLLALWIGLLIGLCVGCASPALSQHYHRRPYHEDPLARRSRGSSLPAEAGAVKAATTWEAPSASDKQMKQAIQSSEIDNGPDSQATVQLITASVKYYVQTKQWQKAMPLLQRLERLGVSNAETNALRQQVSAGLRASGLSGSEKLYSSGQQVKASKSQGFKPVQVQAPSDFNAMLRRSHRQVYSRTSP